MKNKKLLIPVVGCVILGLGIFGCSLTKNNSQIPTETVPQSETITQADITSQPAQTEKTTEETTEEITEIETKEGEIVLSNQVLDSAFEKSQSLIESYKGKELGFSDANEENVIEFYKEVLPIAQKYVETGSLLPQSDKIGTLYENATNSENYKGFDVYKKSEGNTLDDICQTVFGFLTDEKAKDILSGNYIETDDYILVKHADGQSLNKCYENIYVDKDGDKFVLTFSVDTLDLASGMVKKQSKESMNCVFENGKWVFDDLFTLSSYESYFSSLL